MICKLMHNMLISCLDISAFAFVYKSHWFQLITVLLIVPSNNPVKRWFDSRSWALLECESWSCHCHLSFLVKLGSKLVARLHWKNLKGGRVWDPKLSKLTQAAVELIQWILYSQSFQRYCLHFRFPWLRSVLANCNISIYLCAKPPI